MQIAGTDGLPLDLPKTHAAMGIYLNGGESSPDIARVYRSILATGDVVMDVGAHIGEYVRIAAREAGAAGEVHAFEPDHRVFSHLIRNICLGQAVASAPTIANAVALADAGGSGALKLNADSTDSSLVFGAPETPTADVEVTSIDEYLDDRQIARVDVVRMNAEGSELSILEGAARTLARGQPRAWLLECHSDNLYAACSAHLANSGYELLELDLDTVYPYVLAIRR